MTTRNIYDEHTCVIRNTSATKEQLIQSLKDVIVNYNETLKNGERKLDTRLLINYVTNKYGDFTGIAFVYFKDEEVASLITNTNKDGSERIEIVYLDNPSCIKKEEDEIDFLDENINWADFVDDDSDSESCIKEKIMLPRIMDVPQFKYNDEQLENMRDNIIVRNNTNTNFNPDDIILPQFEYLDISRAFPEPPNLDNDEVNYAIKSTKVPKNVTQLQLFNIFSKFTKFKGENNKYPKICLFSNDKKRFNQEFNTAVIIFKEYSYDAGINMRMNKVVKINNDTMFFKFCKSNDYDLQNCKNNKHTLNNNRSSSSSSRTRSSSSSSRTRGSSPSSRTRGSSPSSNSSSRTWNSTRGSSPSSNSSSRTWNSTRGSSPSSNSSSTRGTVVFNPTRGSKTYKRKY